MDTSQVQSSATNAVPVWTKKQCLPRIPTANRLCYELHVLDVGRFAYKSFRLQVDSPTSRSFRLHDQVDSPTRFESIRLHLSRFAYTYKSKYFVKIGENHCPQLTKDSYLTVFSAKFQDVTAFESGDQSSALCALSDFLGERAFAFERKITQQQLCSDCSRENILKRLSVKRLKTNR